MPALTSPWAARRFPPALLTALLLTASPALWAACDQNTGHAESVSIENGLLRVTVDPRDGKLLELVDLQAKHRHVGDAKNLGGLWELEVVIDGRRAVLNPEQAKTFRWEIPSSGQRRLRLTWKGFTLPGASECQVEATVRLPDDEPVSRWEIAVQRPPGLELRAIRFPRVWGLGRQTDERLAVPVWMGQRAADPRSLLLGSDGRGRRLSWDYPGRLSK